MRNLKESLLDSNFDFDININFKGGRELAEILTNAEWGKLRHYDHGITVRSRGMFEEIVKIFMKNYKGNSHSNGNRNTVRIYTNSPDCKPNPFAYIRIEKTLKVVPGALVCHVYTIEGLDANCSIIRTKANIDTNYNAEPVGYAPAELTELLDYFINEA